MGTYCDHDDVSSYLQRQAPYTASTVPTADTVEQIIEGVEDEIDDATGHAWRPRRPPGREWHDVQLDYQWRIGWPVPYVQLDHWQVLVLDSAKGDVLDVLEGNAYTDYLLPANSKTEGRAADYFLEERHGRIYFPQSFPLFRTYSKAVRVTYRYGEVDVWGDVHRLAVWMAASEILNQGVDRVVLGGGLNAPEGVSVSEAIGNIQKKVDKKLGNTHWIRSPRPRFRISGGPRRGWW